MDTHRLALGLAFATGACATAAVQSNASPRTAAPPQISTAPSEPQLVVSAEQSQRRTAPSGTATVTFLARGENAFVARLDMQAGAAVPEHQDATEEYIHILEGGGEIVIDGTTYPLSAGSTVYMPAGATVSFQNGDAPMAALQVFAGPEPAAKYNAWTVLK